MPLFFTQVEYGSGHFCSGILISNFTVLTSASCLLKTNDEFYKAGELKVAMGSLNRFEKDDRFTFYTHVKAIKTHGRFNKKTYANNLAILEVGLLTLNLIFYES
jgi:V8-like Glu-specific endopeptidase